MRKITVIILVLLLIPIVLLAQDKYKKHPGYVDLSNIDGFMDSEETVEVFITKPLLKIVASVTKQEDPELHELLKNLELIRVDKFSVDKKQASDVKKAIDDISKSLNNNKWMRIVRVKERNEHVEIFTKNDDENVVGLLVMVYEKDGEAVFVNIVGKIDMNQLGKLSQKFDIPKLDSLDTKAGKMKK